MSVPRGRVFTSCVLFVVIVGAAGSLWRVRAQNPSAARPAPVQPLNQRIPPAAVTKADRGATYHALEAQATRVTTRFTDAIAVGDRTADGGLSTRLTNMAGNNIASFKVHHVDAESDSLEFAIADSANPASWHVARRSGLRPTLDWTNEQLYSLWKDRNAIAASFEWQDTLLRPSGAPPRNIAEATLQIDTEWRGGLSARVIRKIGTHISYIDHRRTTGLVFVSLFSRDGVEAGSSQWWPEEQTFAFAFPGLTEGYVDAARLSHQGGWSFAPDMAWLNMQNLAFYQFHTLIKERGTVSQRHGSWLDKIGAFIAPQLHANEPGCDNLHWLDGSIFRACCDTHDICYQKQDPNCGSSSWWMWWSSWRCDVCNIYVVYCFMTGGSGGVFYRLP